MRFPIRVGVSGASRGSGFVSAIASVAGRAQLYAVHDPVAATGDSFAVEHHVPHRAKSFEELVERCDVIVIASPQQYHAPQAAYALRSGKHVLSEVPAIVSLEQAHLLLEAARQSSCVYMLAENYCYTRENLIIGQMARAGLFGDLYFGESEYVHEMKDYQIDPFGNPTWRHHWQVGRNAHTYPTHSLGPLMDWFDDRITAVSCIGTGRHTDPEHTIEDTVVLSARTHKGSLLRVRLDLLSNRPHLMNYYALQGTQGAYEAPRSEGQAPRVYLEGVTPHGTWESLERFVAEFLPERYSAPPEGGGHWGSDAWPFLDFLDAIEGRFIAPLDIHRALELSLPTIASEVSMAQHGAWVHVPDPRTLTAGIGINPGLHAPLD